MPAARLRRLTAPGAGDDPRATPPTAAASHLVLVTPAPAEHEPEPELTPAEQRAAFVHRLRAAREHRGIALDAIAASTKVNASLLSALERGDVSRWPRGIFRRSYFRGYVAAIGLPPDDVLRDFLKLFPDEPEFAFGDPPEAATVSDLRLVLAPTPWSPARLSRPLADLLVVALFALLLTWSIGQGIST